ncbi:MAG: hypothetical protein ACRDTN_06985 [Mycobacterium sp.]
MFTVIGFIGYMIQPKKHTTSTPATSTPAPPAAELDGTYRLDYDFAKDTQNGAPDPQPNTNNTAWWAFRSSCPSTGCVATGTKLDYNNHQVALTPADTVDLHFVDGHWQAVRQRQVPQDYCLGANGTVTAGADTERIAWSLEPRPDGALQGVQTDTMLTNECAFQGNVNQAPFVATRIGDVPSGVTVADPAIVTASPTASTPHLVAGGPVLDGIFRVDYDGTHQTRNGDPTTGGTHATDWWAFRSLCAVTGCVATGSQLADTNHQETTGVALVVHFADGHWQNTPTFQPPTQCPGTNGTVTDTETHSWSFEPQPDGTLRGVLTITVLTNECGNQGTVWRTPMVVTRMGDVPPTVILADPTLFVAPTAPATDGPH